MKTVPINDQRNLALSDSDVVKRILSGEKELYEILLRRNNQKLYRVIRAYLSEEDEIEDVMQNTYMKSYEKLFQFKHNSLFSTWLIRIGINEALARIKRKGKYFVLSDTAGPQDRIIELKDLSSSNPERKMIEKEAKELLEKAIDSLEPKYKTVYILREIEEMSVAETSDCLQITKTNVKTRLHRARLLLKEQLYELSLTTDIFEFGFHKCDRLVDNLMKSILSA